MKDDDNVMYSGPPSDEDVKSETELLLDPEAAFNWKVDRVGPLSRPIVVYFIMILLIISNLSTLAILLGEYHQESDSQKSWLPPEVPSTEIFKFQRIFGNAPSHDSEASWNALMPDGRGFVTIRNESVLPEQPGLNQSISEPPAMVAVFHQLHCVYVTRRAYFSARAGNIDEVHVEHLSHCWDYLRQTIMCHSDTTLEWLPPPPNDIGSTGWGYKHTCRDYGTIFQWAERNRWTKPGRNLNMGIGRKL